MNTKMTNPTKLRKEIKKSKEQYKEIIEELTNGKGMKVYRFIKLLAKESDNEIKEKIGAFIGLVEDKAKLSIIKLWQESEQEKVKLLKEKSYHNGEELVINKAEIDKISEGDILKCQT